MKTKILLFLFFGLAISQAKAQDEKEKTTCEDKKCCKCPEKTKQKKLVYNFKDKTIESETPLKLKNGDIYTIEIKSINQNLYKIEVDSKDTSFSKPLDFSVYSSFIPSSFESIAKTINSFTFSNLTNNKADSALFFKEDYTIQICLADSVYEKMALIDRITAIKTTLNSNSSYLSDKEKELTKLFGTFNDSIENWTNNLRKALIIDYTPNFDPLTIDRIERLFTLTNKTASDLKEEIKITIKCFNNFSEKQAKLITDQREDSKQQKIKSEYSKIIQVLDSLDELSSDKAKMAFRNKFYDVMNNSKKDYTTMPMQFDEEQTLVKIRITPHDTASRLPSYFTTYKIKEKVKMYAGIGPGIYFTDLRDDNYSIQGKTITDTTNNYRLIQETTSKNEIGISLLVKAGIKPFKSDIIGFHANIGAGMSLSSTVRPRAMYGLGVSVGRKHNLTLDFGGISGNVNVLSNAFQTGTDYSEKPESVVISKLQTKFYMSIGYLYTF
jgi:hypothetical protein